MLPWIPIPCWEVGITGFFVMHSHMILYYLPSQLIPNPPATQQWKIPYTLVRYFILHVWVHCLGACMFTTYVMVPIEVRRGHQSPLVTESCQLTYRTEVGSLPEQQLLLPSSKPSLQPSSNLWGMHSRYYWLSDFSFVSTTSPYTVYLAFNSVFYNFLRHLHCSWQFQFTNFLIVFYQSYNLVDKNTA